MIVLLLQQRDEEFNTDDSADEDVVNNYCYMFATLNTPPDFKVIVLIITRPGIDKVKPKVCFKYSL